MQSCMNTAHPQVAHYAISPGTPALQVNALHLRRRYAISLLALVVIAAGLGYLLGRSQGLTSGSASRIAAVDALRGGLIRRHDLDAVQVYMLRSIDGKLHALGNVLCAEWMRAVVDLACSGLVATEPHDAELGLDHSRINTHDANAASEHLVAHGPGD